jgi:MFS transporter, ACS family, hexuronate transporter
MPTAPDSIVPAPTRAGWWKWWITGLLLLATTINYMDRQTLASVSQSVTEQLHLSEEQFGDLEMAFGSLAFGYLADRISVYWLYPIVLGGWSLMGFASAHTKGCWPLLA